MVILGKPAFDDYSLGSDKEKKRKRGVGSFEEFADENILQDNSKIVQPLPKQSKEQLEQNLFIGNTEMHFYLEVLSIMMQLQ